MLSMAQRIPFDGLLLENGLRREPIHEREYRSMSEKHPECPLYNPLNCKEYYNPKLCAFVRKDKICLKKKKPKNRAKK